jgi:cell division protein FtsW
MFTRSNRSFIGNWWWKIDKITMFLAFLLIIFGVICVSSASFFVAKKIDLQSSFFIKKHLWYAFISMNVIVLISFLSSEKIEKYSTPFYLFSVFLLFSTFFFGIEIKGSKRWLYFFGLSIQPSEFMKIFFVLMNAKILSLLSDENFSLNKDHLKIYLLSFTLCSFSMGIIILQPDIGMACLIFATWICQIFISGIPIILLAIPMVFFVISFGFAYIFFDHVHYRINNFISGSANSSNIYQIKQSFSALKNGGFFGVGPGQGKIKVHLPDSHTDFIFSVIGEEFGLIACIILISMYIFIVIRSIKKVQHEENLFPILVVIGLAMEFLIQAMINIGVNIQLLPAKGMTLPFISYGGSSIISASLLIGIILSINKKKYGDLIKI